MFSLKSVSSQKFFTQILTELQKPSIGNITEQNAKEQLEQDIYSTICNFVEKELFQNVIPTTFKSSFSLITVKNALSKAFLVTHDNELDKYLKCYNKSDLVSICPRLKITQDDFYLEELFFTLDELKELNSSQIERILPICGYLKLNVNIGEKRTIRNAEALLINKIIELASQNCIVIKLTLINHKNEKKPVNGLHKWQILNQDAEICGILKTKKLINMCFTSITYLKDYAQPRVSAPEKYDDIKPTSEIQTTSAEVNKDESLTYAANKVIQDLATKIEEEEDKTETLVFDPNAVLLGTQKSGKENATTDQSQSRDPLDRPNILLLNDGEHDLYFRVGNARTDRNKCFLFAYQTLALNKDESEIEVGDIEPLVSTIKESLAVDSILGFYEWQELGIPDIKEKILAILNTDKMVEIEFIIYFCGLMQTNIVVCDYGSGRICYFLNSSIERLPENTYYLLLKDRHYHPLVKLVEHNYGRDSGEVKEISSFSIENHVVQSIVSGKDTRASVTPINNSTSVSETIASGRVEMKDKLSVQRDFKTEFSHCIPYNLFFSNAVIEISYSESDSEESDYHSRMNDVTEAYCGERFDKIECHGNKISNSGYIKKHVPINRLKNYVVDGIKSGNVGNRCDVRKTDSLMRGIRLVNGIFGIIRGEFKTEVENSVTYYIRRMDNTKGNGDKTKLLYLLFIPESLIATHCIKWTGYGCKHEKHVQFNLLNEEDAGIPRNLKYYESSFVKEDEFPDNEIESAESNPLLAVEAHMSAVLTRYFDLSSSPLDRKTLLEDFYYDLAGYMNDECGVENRRLRFGVCFARDYTDSANFRRKKGTALGIWCNYYHLSSDSGKDEQIRNGRISLMI